MRMHIEIDDELSEGIAEFSGVRGRSDFVRAAIKSALVRARAERDLRLAAGSISDADHDWDVDPADWVRQQRSGDDRRVG